MVIATERVRLDELLVLRGEAPSRERARALVLAGSVRIPGLPHPKPGLRVPHDVTLTVAATPPFVSRGGLKLAHAMDRFSLSPRERTCADVGASTGGFTDCLLQRGAALVYAIDVGYGQLDYRLRSDPRVVVMERTNARYLQELPSPVSFVTVDASFISLRILLPAIRRFSAPESDLVTLIKPQFEAGKGQVGKGGVIRDPLQHEAILRDLLGWAETRGYGLRALCPSPLKGPAGNIEFLAHLKLSGPSTAAAIDIAAIVHEAHHQSGPDPTL